MFPEKTLDSIKKSGLLTVCIDRKNGGQNIGLVSGTNYLMLKLLKLIGSGNLVAGRILEGHINAQLLIHQFGSKRQKARFAKYAFAGKFFGVWNTQAKDGTTLKHNKKGDFILNGSKTFATGTGYVSRPIITASLANGSWQMCIVPLNKIKKNIDSSWWNPMGMKASRSFKISFKNVIISKHDLLGIPNDYYSQPQFGGGAVRFAAVQLGGAEMLLKETIEYLKTLNRTDDPYQKMRLGEMTIAITSGNQWIEGAAKRMDEHMQYDSVENSEIFLTYTNMMRTAIEEICTKVIVLCQKCVGARGLNKPYHFERIIRDLNTYLRQPAPDTSLADIGRFALKSEIELDRLWDHKENNNENI
ncbi:acyl-CoA dehydrogenase family protein [Kaistella chaponensis]|uniref:acyl-CoA dehydrogenase family protein n=1 Tax=Kaistella chaponensis TaxID=713588 RepID=UPI00117C6362|nr:acyl-CoA dehydrogenase family protein [Kaistella chaponensis]